MADINARLANEARAKMLLNALKMWKRTGLPISEGFTRRRGLQMATEYTKKTYVESDRGLDQAINDVEKWIQDNVK